MKLTKKQLPNLTLTEIFQFDIENKTELMREILSENLPEVLNVEATQPDKTEVKSELRQLFEKIIDKI